MDGVSASQYHTSRWMNDKPITHLRSLYFNTKDFWSSPKSLPLSQLSQQNVVGFKQKNYSWNYITA